MSAETARQGDHFRTRGRRTASGCRRRARRPRSTSRPPGGSRPAPRPGRPRSSAQVAARATTSALIATSGRDGADPRPGATCGSRRGRRRAARRARHPRGRGSPTATPHGATAGGPGTAGDGAGARGEAERGRQRHGIRGHDGQHAPATPRYSAGPWTPSTVAATARPRRGGRRSGPTRRPAARVRGNGLSRRHTTTLGDGSTVTGW